MKITIEELQRKIRRGPGLVIGPGLGTHNTREAECLKGLVGKFPLPKNTEISPAADFREYVDLLRQKSIAPDSDIRHWIIDFFKTIISQNPQIHGLVGVKWSAIISLSHDDFFRNAFHQHLFERPTKWTLTTVSSLAQKPSFLTTPYYALLGDIADNTTPCRLAVSQSDYLARKRSWAALLSGMPDYIRSDPILFLGTSTIPDRVLEFVNEMLRLAPKIPKSLIFLSGDPSLNSASLKNLTEEYCEIFECTATITELSTALDPEALSIFSLPLFSEVEVISVSKKLIEKIEDQVVFIPKKADLKYADKSERNRLLDLLFRPNYLDWSPYSLGLEFRREICADLIGNIDSAMKQAASGKPQSILVVGEAGIGKTVALRSVAFEIAQRNAICLWVKKSYGETSGGRFDSVVQALNKEIGKDKEVHIFVDDPIGSRVSAEEIEKSLRSAIFKSVLIVCTRKSESYVANQGAIVGDFQLEITAEFTTAEFAALPEYLVKLGIAPDSKQANAMMPVEGFRASKDVLCALWYLLPQTKGAIEDSLTGEYFRLGGVERVITSIAGEATDKIGKLRAAYEFVTAVSGMDNSAVPVEVLVSALKISYSDWTEQCAEKRPIWGLLYEDVYPAAETYAYRTRNYVVTEVLLRAINYGSIGSTGQYRLLKGLLAACTSSAAPYKSFIFDILVAKRKLIQSRFTYEQAMDLYDTALAAYPGQLNVVKHHQCLVKRTLGGDALSVYDELKHLITSAENSDGADNDTKGNLHTSAAAALTQAVREGKVDPRDGANRIFEHIGTAILLDQFSMHTHHVHAVALINLASNIRDRDPKTSVVNLERAARIIDRALMLLSPISNETGRRGEDALMFEILYDELSVAIHGLDEFKKKSFDLFEKNQDQAGLALWTRLALREARRTNRGKDYKKVDEALREIFKKIADANIPPAVELRICRAELVISWHLDNAKGPIYWEQFSEDLHVILQSKIHSTDVVWLFFLGVTYYNLRKFPEAEVCFQRLRLKRIDREFGRSVRCFYIADKSEPQILEGILKGGKEAGNYYMYSSALGADLSVRHNDFPSSSSEVTHFKIGFTLTGPIALNRDAQIDIGRIGHGKRVV